MFAEGTTDRPDREAIAEAKNVCAGCGADLTKVGPSEGETRGDEFECTRDRRGYVEWRLYGDNYYE